MHKRNALPTCCSASSSKAEIPQNPTKNVEEKATGSGVETTGKDFQCDTSISNADANIPIKEESACFDQSSSPMKIQPCKNDNDISNAENTLQFKPDSDQHASFCEEASLGDWDSSSGKFIGENVNCRKRQCHNLPDNCTKTECVDRDVREISGDATVSLCTFIKSEKDLETFCNISSFKILEKLTKMMDEFYPQEQPTYMSTRDCIILTTAKLVLDVSFSALGVFFNQVCEATVCKIFYDTLEKLSRILQATITRVPKEEILRNMPKCFETLQSTTAILNCTKVDIQKSQCLKCNAKFDSHYLGDRSVKFMMEMTPAGLITSVSKFFDGRTSDKDIFDNSGIVQSFENAQDTIIFNNYGGNQLIPEESEKLACINVLIERMNKRMKSFKILNNGIPWYFINHIDDIFIVCCGLTNLGAPIFNDDEFL